MYKKIICFLICFLTSLQTESAYTSLIRKKIIKADTERVARLKAIDRITDEVALEMIREELGDRTFNENSKKIKDQLGALKKRFIPTYKTLKSEKAQDSYHFEVELKISKRDMRQVLKERGFFIDYKKTGIILPFMEFNNQVNEESYRWWSSSFKAGKTLKSLSYDFEKEFYQGFLERGFFLLRPQAFKMIHILPDFLRKVYLTQTEMVQITDLKRGQLYITGQVNILNSPLGKRAYRLRARLDCRQVSNGKSVAQINLSLDTNGVKTLSQISEDVKKLALSASRDLAGQIYDLWQGGGFDSQTLQLVVAGELNHRQIEEIKELLYKGFGSKEKIRERLFEPERVTFELDYSQGVESFLKKLKKINFHGFITQIVSNKAGKVILDVKPAY